MFLRITPHVSAQLQEDYKFSLLELPENESVQDLLQVMRLDSEDSSDPHNLLKALGVLVSALSGESLTL